MRSARQTPLAHARSLWPGHAGAMPNDAWQPENFPLQPDVATGFLRSLQALTCDELDAMRNAWSASNFSKAIKENEECAALNEFAGRPRLRGALDAAAEFAQQLLLWSWQQETTLSELDELERECLLKEEAISSHFLEEKDTSGMATHGCARLELAWQPVAANAAFFILPSQSILAEGGMAEDLLETLEFAIVRDDEYGPMPHAGHLLKASAPLWEVLGFKRPGNKEAASIYNPLRTWLIWREE